MRKKSYTLLAIALALVLAGSGGYIAWKTLDYQKGAEDYEAAVRTAGLSSQPQRSAPPDVQEEMDPWASTLMDTNLEALRVVNSDVVGWIMIPETELSYPLLQGADNQYYLNHTWNNERSSVGAIFMECQCDPGLNDFNTIIYGHRMNNASMFGTLAEYWNADFLPAHPTIYLANEEGVRLYDIFAVCEVNKDDIVYGLDITRPDVKEQLIAFSLEHSAIDTGIVPDADDQILTLSTCTTGRGRSAKRWVVQAVLVKKYGR